MRQSGVHKPSGSGPGPSGGIRAFFRSLGPGLVTGAADDDPSGIGTHSQVGAAVRLRPRLDVRPQLPADGRQSSRSQPRSAASPAPASPATCDAIIRGSVLWFDGDAAAGRQHRQSRRRPERDGRGLGLADRRQRHALHPALRHPLRRARSDPELSALCRDPQMDDSVAVHLCRRRRRRARALGRRR